MQRKTDIQVWPVDKPFVIFMTPGDYSERFASLTRVMIKEAQSELGVSDDWVNSMGMIANSRQQCIEALYLLEELGVEPKGVSLIILWGETANYIDFHNDVPDECGLAYLAMMRSGVVIPTLRLAFKNRDWWEDPLHQEYVLRTFIDMISDGRMRPSDGDVLSCIYSPNMLN